MIIFDLTYDIKNDLVLVDTNIQPKYLESFFRSQMGEEIDSTPPSTKDVYHVKIQFNLETNVFTMTSDTGNNGLALGILEKEQWQTKLGSARRSLKKRIQPRCVTSVASADSA